MDGIGFSPLTAPSCEMQKGDTTSHQGECEGGEAVQRRLWAWEVSSYSARARCSLLVTAVMSLGAPMELKHADCFLSVLVCIAVGMWVLQQQ